MTHRPEDDYREVGERGPFVLYRALITRCPGASEPSDIAVVYVSPACLEMFGCPSSDLLGSYERWLNQVDPRDQDLLRQALASVVDHTQASSTDYRLKNLLPSKSEGQKPLRGQAILPKSERAETEVRWVRDTRTPLLDEKGELLGWDGIITDVTTEHSLQHDLNRITKMFEVLATNMNAGVLFIESREGRPFWISEQAQHILGLKEDPSVGLEHVVEHYHLRQLDGTPYPTQELPVCQALANNLPAERTDVVVHRPDGQRIPLLTWAAPIDLNDEGRPSAAIWAIEDLTVVHQAEEARHTIEARLDAIYGSLAEAVLVVNASGLIADCNPSAAKLFGRSAERLCRTWLFDSGWAFQRENGALLPVEDHPFSLVIRDGQPVRNVPLGLQLRIPSKDPGRRQPIRWLLANATPVFGATENIEEVVLSLADVSEQKQALETLRQSEEKYRELLEGLPVMVFVSNLEAEVIYANPATKAITGYDLDEFRRPALWGALIHPEDLAQVQAASARSKAGEVVHLEMRYRAKNGSQKVGYCVVQPYWQNKRIQGNVTVIMDVTRERKLEEELRHAQRLELVGRLSSGIAHDFNNILTAVLTLTDFVKAQLPPDHTAQRDLETLTGAGQQAAHLARQLLTFSKQQPVDFQPVSVNQIIRRTLELLKTTWGLHIQVDSSLDVGEPHIWGDPVQMQQVLINLLLNARDAMPHGGKVLVKTITRRGPRRQIDASSSGLTDPRKESRDPSRANSMWVVLSVEDTGIGIEEPLQRQIFEPFFTTKEHGTGLGLAVVQQILASHGGWVEVRSRPNVGTCFEILLPVRESETATSKQEDTLMGSEAPHNFMTQ